MVQIIQLCYICTIIIGMIAFAVQLMVRYKNLAVTNQMVKGGNTTIFLALIVTFNICDFLIIFLGDILGENGISWIYVVENMLEVGLAYALLAMERDYARAEYKKWLSVLFTIVATVILWTDTTYTAGIVFSSETVYTTIMIIFNGIPLILVAGFGLKYFRSIAKMVSEKIVNIYLIVYNMIFIFFCVVVTVSILDERTTTDMVDNNKEVYVIFWLVFNILNAMFIWKSCQSVDMDKLVRDSETIDDKIERIAAEYKFSEREAEIAKLLYKGRNNTDIAKELYLSPNTIKVHASNLYKKLGVSNRVQAIQVLRGEEIE